MSSEKAAHVITARQKKGALSSVKKKQKQPKNVLVRNFIECWPCLDTNQSETFEKLLGSFAENPTSQQIHIGLQSTLRKLKSGDAKYLIIADELSPRWFATHLIAMALNINRNLKIFIIPKLKEMMKRLKSVAAICCSTTSSCEALDNFYDDELKFHTELVKNFCKLEPSVNVAKKRKRKERKTEDCGPQVVFLKKSESHELSFTPMEVEAVPNPPEADEKPKLGSDFIGFSKSKDDDKMETPEMPMYRPVKIKKTFGNENRKKNQKNKS